MSFLLWQREGEVRVASPRLVLRAAEVPLLQDAQQLRDAMQRRSAEQTQALDAANALARAEGHARGLEEGRRAAREELAAHLTALAHHSAADGQRLRGEVGVLALQVVRKLLGAFSSDERLAALAARAAADLLPARPVALIVHADTASAVRERLAQAFAGTAVPIDVRGDADCAPDTCRLETEHGTVDVALEIQLAHLEAAWRQAGAAGTA